MEREDIQKAATQHANMIGWDHDPKEIRGLFAYSFEKGAEWQLQQLGHPDPPGEQGSWSLFQDNFRAVYPRRAKAD